MTAPTTQQLAMDFLLANRAQDSEGVRAAAARISSLSSTQLLDDLPDDPARLAFWINLYNGAIIQQREYPLGSWAQRSAFFRRRLLEVAGRSMSLDGIEHGILRRSRWRLGLGFARNPLPSPFERQHRIGHLDPRIHFALNCAAASCPPIAAYQPTDVEAQLDLATRSYLASTVKTGPDHLTVPRIFLWFAGDFGGPPGIRSFLRRHGVQLAGWPLRFGAYDWTPAPGQWLAGEADNGGN